MTHHLDPPTHDARRQAVANVLAWAPGLVRYAARFTRSIEDAEDAYQCAMEIALTKAPCTERNELVAWLHTVIRHEALRIRRRRQRERPTETGDLDDRLCEEDAGRLGPDAIAEWRERYSVVQDGLLGLGERTRICLMLRSAGMQRQEIADMLGITLRTVSREIHQGRTQLRAFELRMSTGEECARIAQLVDLAVDGEATPGDLRRLSRHTRRCPSCRGSYRTALETAQLLATFVPAGLAGSDLMAARTPDAAAMVSWWERLSGATTVRTGTIMQWWLDVPQLMATKAGAGALAAATVGAIGTPIVVSSLRADGAQPRTQQAVVAPPATPPAALRPTPPKTSASGPTGGDQAAAARAGGSAPGSTATPSRKTRPAATSDTATVRITVSRTTSAPITDSTPVRRASTSGGGSPTAEFAP